MTFEHQGLLFHDERWFLDTARERLRSALGGNAHAVLAVSEARAAVLVGSLTPSEGARVHVVDRDGLYEAPGRALAALHRLTLTHEPVTLVAEPPTPSGSAMESREWQRLESVMCTALAPLRLRLLCAYDARALAPGARASVRVTHPTLVGPDGPRPNPGYLGTAAFGARPDTPAPLPATGPVHRLEIGMSLPRLRRELAALCAFLGMAPHRAESLVVAVNELAANVLEHGAGKGSVSVWRGPDRWVCDVFDEHGGLADPLAGYRPADSMRPRGYGLWITRQSCDFMEISGTAEGSTVRLHFVDGLGALSP
ncbi:anti-sigma factor RsbA family regulatory protein [Nocardiopsis sp. CT-R113]|uniref:Anti-sigma factor RsbA family regulatory protein n=1 Tax=Nocardiopsis codii TaxID=3065942 RepID=A0ABU7K159_9ACTN|nr:anti-sigma factor RsbA family regulatory protein [Nocardiopsis sp. CT-R113]MEE2035987.1 anti-sigma factor RsbA family regulatory protein [Nocardiopsis sp. CT-R113]